MTFVGRDVLAIAHDIYIVFFHLKTHCESVYVANNEHVGDGVDCITGRLCCGSLKTHQNTKQTNTASRLLYSEEWRETHFSDCLGGTVDMGMHTYLELSLL